MNNDKQGNTQNLTNQEALEKIKQLAEKESMCLFTTNLSRLPLTTRPMGTQQVDDEGNLWFMSARSSDKNQEIAQDNRVQLFYTNKGNSEYLTVYGTAEILFDKNKIEELWTPIVKAWFKEGKDDPEISLIKVTPEAGYYWDTKYSKMIDLMGILISAVSGKTLDGGIEGKLSA
ncbi:MAG: pyridoxamine 5'-phosphate oxidase family protein [Chitinophagales bacterium]